MLDISEITYFQYKKIVWLSQHLTIIYATEVWSSAPVCCLGAVLASLCGSRARLARQSDTQPGALINYNDIN